MAIDQTGKAPPFVTAQGTARDVSEDDGKPTDLVADGKTDKAKGGDQRDVIASRQQPTNPPSATPPDAPHLRSRPQQMGSAAARVNVREAPQDGNLTPRVPTKQPSAGTGSIDAASKTRVPFKGMR